MKGIIAMLTAVLLTATIAGCSTPVQKVADIQPTAKETRQDDREKEQPQKEQPTKEEPTVQNTVDYNAIKANESGKIMILMYHGIGDKEEEWVRTAVNFRKDLKTLYDNGYRTISLHDYINNNINTPAGFTPVVITFDDGLLNQFNMVEKDGKFVLDPNCAVGIMQDFSKQHSGFGNFATFYVYYPIPFRQKDLIKDKFQYLIDNGFDIGNHSYTHEMLGKMDSEGIQKQLALNVKSAHEYLPGYDIDTMALPYGSRPKDEGLRKLVVSGEYDGVKYANKAVLLVGANPAPAPNCKGFDPSALPRVRASEMKTEGTGLYDWLKYFDKNPMERYISDGDSSTVAVPKGYETRVDNSLLKDKKLIIY